MRDYEKNGSGVRDKVAAEAIQAADRPPEDYRRAIDMMLFAARRMGFRVESRIELRDEKTGRVW